MESAVLISESKSDLTVLLNMAKKLGVGIKRLTSEEVEDLGLINAMKEGRTGKYVDKEEYLAQLRGK